jgi:hypothetical protein
VVLRKVGLAYASIDMIYKIILAAHHELPALAAFTYIAVWNGYVTDVTIGIRWAQGKSFTNAKEHLDSAGAEVLIVPGSISERDLSNLQHYVEGTPTIAIAERPPKQPAEIVVTRSARDTSNDD